MLRNPINQPRLISLFMRATCFLVILVLINSCVKEEALPVNSCLPLKNQPDWKKINFKSDLTIQVPPDCYGGIIGIEGPTFNVFNPDHSIYLRYSFCSPIFCVEYGDTLQDPFPESIIMHDYYVPEATLTHRIEICDDLVVVGLFYFSPDSHAGKLYWRVENVFRESLVIYYKPHDLDEVVSILRSIRRK